MTDTTTLIQRLSDEADLCRNDGATDIAGLLDEAQAALEQQARDKKVADDLDEGRERVIDRQKSIIYEQAAQIEALRADAERMRGALNFIAERMCSDWSQRCQAMVNTARAALRQEQPKGEGA